MSAKNAPTGADESVARDERDPAPTPTGAPVVQAAAPTQPTAPGHPAEPAQAAPERPVSLGALYGALWHTPLARVTCCCSPSCCC